MLISSRNAEKVCDYFRLLGLELCFNQGFCTRETRQSKTAIDLFFSNIESENKIIKSDLTDHYTVIFTSQKLFLKVNKEKTFVLNQLHKLSDEEVRIDANFEVFKNCRKIKNDLEFVAIDESFSLIQEIVYEAKEKTIPAKEVTANNFKRINNGSTIM